MDRPAVGFVGLGKMGGEIARHLVDEGFDLVAYDVDDAATAALAEYGAETAPSPAAVADGADVVCTSLPTPEVVETVFLGDEGLLAGASEGTVAIELSTIDPDTTEELGVVAADHGVDLLDAPVSGDPEAGAEGELTLLVGGPADVVEEAPARVVLDAAGGKVYHVGGVGTGHTLKLINNVMSMGNLLLAMEMVALGTERGIDPETLWEVLTNSGGNSYMFANRMPRVLNRNFEAGFTVDFAKKDLNLAMSMGDAMEFPLVQTALAAQLYTEASAEGYGDRDIGAVVKLFERAAVEADERVDESFDGL